MIFRCAKPIAAGLAIGLALSAGAMALVGGAALLVNVTLDALGLRDTQQFWGPVLFLVYLFTGLGGIGGAIACYSEGE